MKHLMSIQKLVLTLVLLAFTSPSLGQLKEESPDSQGDQNVEVARDTDSVSRSKSKRSSKKQRKRNKKMRLKLAKKRLRQIYKKKYSGVLNVRPTAGVSFSTIEGSDEVLSNSMETNLDLSGSMFKYDYVTGAMGGVLIDVGFGVPRFVMETGLIYHELGFKGELVVPGTSTTQQTTNVDGRFKYLSVPLSGKYYFRGIRSSSIYARGGLTPAFYMGFDSRVSSAGQSTVNSKIDEDVQDFDVLVSAGLGAQFHLNKRSSLILDLGAFRGLIPVYSGKNVVHQGGSIILGISIRL